MFNCQLVYSLWKLFIIFLKKQYENTTVYFSLSHQIEILILHKAATAAQTIIDDQRY